MKNRHVLLMCETIVERMEISEQVCMEAVFARNQLRCVLLEIVNTLAGTDVLSKDLYERACIVARRNYKGE